MPISFNCPHCGHHTMVEDQFAGTSGPCGKCGKTVTIPAAASTGGGGGGWVVAIVLVLVGVGVVGICVVGVLVALLLPAINAAREAARRMECSNQLRQISMAMSMYEMAHGSFPPAFVADDDGRPMHSWRVLLLPYLEQQALYQAYDMSKPWDSPENLALLDEMPSIYACPSGDLGPGMTSYVVVSGPGALFDGARRPRMNHINDGRSNTLLVVEAVQPVRWLEPVDLDFKSMQFWIGGGPGEIGSRHLGGANVIFADGAFRLLPEKTPPETLRGIITPDGGEAVQIPDW